MENFIRIKQWAIQRHIICNHRYGNSPYSLHLDHVHNVAERYNTLLNSKDVENVFSACYCHDLIEDCRVTYNDLLKVSNKVVAEIVYTVTNEKGRTREERANDKYYEEIKAFPLAVFVKVCDRIANVENAKRYGNPMYIKYKHEMEKFCDSIYRPEFHIIFEYLKTL